MPAGRPPLTGTLLPDAEVTAYTEPTLRKEILKALKPAMQKYPLGTCDEMVAEQLGIYTDWVYAVRARQPLPDEPIPNAYYTLLAQRKAATRKRGKQPTPHPTSVTGPLLLYNQVVRLLHNGMDPATIAAVVPGATPDVVQAVQFNRYTITRPSVRPLS